MKQRIESSDTSWPPASAPYAHLDPVIDFLLLHGNALTTPRRWEKDKDGWYCQLRRPIRFDLLRDHFDFSQSILLSDEDNSVLCQNTWIQIKGGEDDKAA
ncbi:MAG: hypothetical protein NT105_15335 [Verrucomicrobia bacterium]|nr:hypothetical protein [Verrucomicrobiota bacterium]